jgi:hypothetical protein
VARPTQTSKPPRSVRPRTVAAPRYCRDRPSGQHHKFVQNRRYHDHQRTIFQQRTHSRKENKKRQSTRGCPRALSIRRHEPHLQTILNRRRRSRERMGRRHLIFTCGTFYMDIILYNSSQAISANNISMYPSPERS